MISTRRGEAGHVNAVCAVFETAGEEKHGSSWWWILEGGEEISV
jgi:hypothetical protein